MSTLILLRYSQMNGIKKFLHIGDSKFHNRLNPLKSHNIKSMYGSFVVYPVIHNKHNDNLNNTAIDTTYNSVINTHTDIDRNCFNDHDQSALTNIDPDITYQGANHGSI